ncbi:MFS transporter [Micromonospora sp. WMMD730]|uniref:MFS transporter n=1 Tax=Micromonospora sp. WMMD730 TaxID=3404128 RepID=UPI003B93B47E
MTDADERFSPPPGYLALFRHPVASRLVTARGISELGDFVGLAALLLLAYDQTQSVLGPAAVYAARALPALLVATVFSGWLDVPARRTLLVWLSVAGAVLIAVPFAAPRPVPAIVAAGLLGAVRAAYSSVNVAVAAESVDAPLRLPLFGLSAFANQIGQVVGLLAGASITVALGPRVALLIDLVSFLVAAVVLAGLPTGQQRRRGPRPPATAGLRTIAGHPVLRGVALLTLATVLSGALPETLAPDLAAGAWRPVVLASSALGGAVFVLVLGRGTWLGRLAGQVTVATALAGALLLAALLVATHAPVWALACANALIGAGGGWLIGAQATFARLAPVERMGQVEATIVAANIVVAGCGIFLLGSAAALFGPAVAYLLAGVLLLVVVLLTRPDRLPADAGPQPTVSPH